MSEYHPLVFSLAAALLSILTLVSNNNLVEADVWDGFQSQTPAAPYERHYDLFYQNLPEVQPCVLTSNIGIPSSQSKAESISLAVDQVSGCVPPAITAQLMLYPFTTANFAKYKSLDGCVGAGGLDTGRAAKAGDTTAKQRISFLESIVPKEQTMGIMLVLHSLSPTEASFNLSCMVTNLANDLNFGNADGRGNTGAVVGTTLQGFFYFQESVNGSYSTSSSPHASMSPYSNPRRWIPQGNGLLSRGANLTVITFSGASPNGLAEYQKVSQRAFLNWQDFHNSKTGVIEEQSEPLYPQEISQSNFNMWMGQHQTVKTYINGLTSSCLTMNTPFPTCFPIGGSSAWGTTEPLLPSVNLTYTYNNASGNNSAGREEDGTPSPPKKNKIAIMVSATTTSYIHDNVPGADAAASGITALISFIDAIAKDLDTFRPLNGDPGLIPQLYFFFFTGEEYGLAGSGRFVKEVNNFNCYQTPNYSLPSNRRFACIWPLRYNTNFTSLDLDSFEHFIHIDQVGASSDLYFHTDSTLDTSSPSQQKVNTILSGYTGIAKGANGGQLVPGPLLSFFRNSSSQLTQSFTTIAGYNSHFRNPHFETSQDLPEFVNPRNIEAASKAVLHLVQKLVQDSTGNTSALATLSISSSNVDTMWNCFGVDLGCDFFKTTFGFDISPGTKPNYYPSVYTILNAKTGARASVQTQFARYFMILSLLGNQPIKVTPPPSMEGSESSSSSGGSSGSSGEEVLEDMTCPCEFPLSQWCHNKKCYWRHSFLHPAFSPYLYETPYYGNVPVYWDQDQDYADYEENNNKPGLVVPVKQPEVYVESIWDAGLGARLATVDSAKHGGFALVSGILTTIATFSLFALIDKVIGPKLKA